MNKNPGRHYCCSSLTLSTRPSLSWMTRGRPKLWRAQRQGHCEVCSWQSTGCKTSSNTPFAVFRSRARRSCPRYSSTSGKTDTFKARLCRNFSMPVRYATLSHRWGPNPTLRQLSSNATELFEEIPVPSLEQVFQEAMAMTWSLDIAYLWIDSLCIIQDSPSDWEIQSRNMGGI